MRELDLTKAVRNLRFSVTYRNGETVMPKTTVFAIAAAAFIVPIVAVVAVNLEQIQESQKVDPKTAKGKVLFFTSPS